MMRAAWNSKKGIKLLLDYKANPYSQNQVGDTILHIATFNYDINNKKNINDILLDLLGSTRIQTTAKRCNQNSNVRATLFTYLLVLKRIQHQKKLTIPRLLNENHIILLLAEHELIPPLQKLLKIKSNDNKTALDIAREQKLLRNRDFFQIVRVSQIKNRAYLTELFEIILDGKLVDLINFYNKHKETESIKND